VAEHFVVPGAQRSGTTWLYRVLDQHPEIGMARPMAPEPKFFLDAAAVDRGLAAYRAALFAGRPAGRVLGEKSTSYLETPEVPSRIRALLPEARIIVVLRDPIERAVSNYRYSRANGIETGSIETAFYDEARRVAALDWSGISVCPVAYLTRGRYVEQLARWDDVFPRSHVRIVLFERLVQDPAAVADVFRFLGVDADFRPVLPPRPVNAAPGGGVALDEGLRRYLVEYFAEPNRRLSERYGLELSCWPSAGASGRSSPVRAPR
jgi:hypothetical protein